MLLLLPFAFSLPTLAEDNSPAAVVNPDARENPVIPGSGNELPPTPDPNSNNGNSETPVANPDQHGTLGTPEEAVIDHESQGIFPAKDAFPDGFRKAPPLMSPGPVAINATNFPDEQFRNYVLKTFDRDDSGVLSTEELADANEMIFSNLQPPVSDLQGIEYFKSLTTIYVHNQQLRKLDVSLFSELSTLGVFNNAIDELTFGKNPLLKWVACSENKLTSLDVSTVDNLTSLYCDNNQLTNLTLGKHPLLHWILCNNNFLRSLSLNQYKSLQYLFINNNQLTSLDLSNNPELFHLEISNNHLTSLDLSNNRQLSVKYFKGEHQTYSIEVDRDTLEFDLSSLPGNFIPARASGWVGASVSGMTLKLDPSMPATVTYNYDADLDREGFIMDVTLFVTYVPEDILIPCPYGAVICPTQPAYQTIPLTPVPVQQVPADNIQGQVSQLPKTGEHESRAIAISSLLLLSLGAFFMISRRK